MNFVQLCGPNRVCKIIQSVTFHYFSSDLVAEWSPFGKKNAQWVDHIFFLYLTICNFSHFPFWI